MIDHSHLLHREANKASMRNEYDLSDSLTKQAEEVVRARTGFRGFAKENSDLVKFPDCIDNTLNP